MIGIWKWVVCLFALLVVTSAFSYSSMEVMAVNQAATTDYVFAFMPTNSYSTLKAVITFPIQFELSSFAHQLECYYSCSGAYDDYTQTNFVVQPSAQVDSLYLVGSVVVEVNDIVPSIPIYVLVKNVNNPHVSQSSYFRVCLRVQAVTLECNKAFGRVSFKPQPLSSTSTISIISEPEAFVGQGASYLLEMSLSSQVLTFEEEGLSIRVNFPDEFNSDDPICSIGKMSDAGLHRSFTQIDTTILPGTPSKVQCGSITNLSQWIGTTNTLKIKVQNMINPLNSKTYSQFSVDVIRNVHQQILENFTFPSLTVLSESLNVSISQSNLMRISTNMYYFFLNHEADLSEDSSIVVTFNNGSWTLHSVTLMNGFSSPSTFTYQISDQIVIIQNYGTASKKQQQIFALNLTSTSDAGSYSVTFETKQNGNLFGQWSGEVQINSTIGKLDLFSFSAVQNPVKLPVDSTGPLQLTFFLNYEMPPSDDVTYGTLQVSVYPQIPQPDPDLHGVIKCFWMATLQAECTFDNTDPTKSVITLTSPHHHSFKYSQMPVIITTEGGNTTEDTGFTIDLLVQRYRFQCVFHLYNSTSIPSEVFYTTWIADAIEMTNWTAASLTHECDQWTYLEIALMTPYLDASVSKQFRILVQFLNADGGAWASAIGYTANTLYKQYPCIVEGLTGENIKCDLYTYVDTLQPYNNLHINNDLTGPFIMIYGFEQNIPEGSEVVIHIPKIKIGSMIGSDCSVGVSILQETPAEKQPYVELYYQNILVFTSSPSISLAPIPANSSQNTSLFIQQDTELHFEWELQNTSNIAQILYEISPDDLPSLDTVENVCNGSICWGFGLPANWIIEYLDNGTMNSSAHMMDTVGSYIRTMDYLTSRDQLVTINVFTYDGNGNTLQWYQLDLYFMATVLPACTFSFIDSTLYGGLEQWYEVTFTTSDTTVSEYPFVRVIVGGQLVVVDPIQCKSSTFVAYNESGILCERQDAYTIIVYNIQTLTPSTSYQLQLKLQTQSVQYSTTIDPYVEVHVNHNYSVDSSITTIAENVVLTEAPIMPILSPPVQFTIHNPQIKNEKIKMGYIGPMYIYFQSTTSGVYDIDISMPDHRYNGGVWSTPNSNDDDPVVCMVNQNRYGCTPTNTPLQISIQSAEIVAGTNQLILDTEYIDPFNGIQYPAAPGYYPIHLTINSVEVSFFARISAPSFLHMEAGTILKDINTESVYIVNITLPDTHIYPNGYLDVANYSRIVIEFPTYMGSNPIFAQNLGGYEGKLHERVGCHFQTGTPYITFEPATTLQCRLIPPLQASQPVKVEIINHAAFSSNDNSLSVMIFKVWNPAQQYSSLDITAKIEHVEVGTGYIYPLYEQTYHVWMDPRPENTNIITYPSVDGPTVQLFQASLDVGDYGYMMLTSHTVSSDPLNNPYYTLVKLPSYLPPENSQVTSPFPLCPTAAFEYCVSVPEINYLLIKGIFNASQYQVYIKDFPISISQDDSYFYASVIQEGRLTGIVEHVISADYRWQQLQGSIVFGYCQAAGLQDKVLKGRERFDVVISFTTSNYIPETGSIQIGFPPSITNIQPHCRSVVSNSSMLYGKAGVTGSIGCQVQNTNKWVITGFQEVNPSTNVIIRGTIDLPGVSGSIGIGHITTYADNDLVDIHTNGSIIDHVEVDFMLSVVDNQAMNVNEDVFATQRTVVRAGDVGQFRMVLQPSSSITSTDTITLRMSMNSIKGNSGGFSFTVDAKVCQFLHLSTNQHIGCQVSSQSSDSTTNYEAIVYILSPTQTLNSGEQYQIRLTTQKYSYPSLPEGIAYPSVPGYYKIQLITDISSNLKVSHRYQETYGTEFSALTFTQYNYVAEEYNLIWVELTPTTTITTDQQIIVQLPTLSSDGTVTLFDDNLGLNEYDDGDSVAVDIFDSAPFDNTLMNCRIYHGDQSRGTPVKLVCGDLQSSITNAQTLRFSFGLINPPKRTPSTTPSQISIPLIIYSFDPYYFRKTNFNLVNAAVIVFNSEDILAPNGHFSTTSNQYQTQNDDILLGDAHTYQLEIGDSFVMRWNFPLRVNGLVAGACKTADGVTTYGDAYYHEKLRIIVCKVTTNAIPAQVSPLASSMMIEGFYTPWYRLADVQRYVHGIATYHSTSTSEVINYFDLFPHLQPRHEFNTLSTLQLTSKIGHNIACQADDYIFTVRLQDVASVQTDIQYTKMIAIYLPLTTVVDYFPLNSDCMEHYTSDIEVVLCEIDMVAMVIYVQIVPGSYTNGLSIVIETKGLALRNPCTFWATADITQFTVYFFSWENVTALDTRSIDYAYMEINGSNLNSFTLTYTQEEYPAASFSTYFTFDWVHVPHQRYYSQFPQYTTSQYSPFSFEIWLTASLSTLPSGSYHTLTLHYGTDYIARTIQSTFDLQYDKPVCYLNNNRVSRCFLDTGNNKMYMEFQFGLSDGKPIHVYFSILDPREPNKNGFLYSGTSDMSKVRIDLTPNGGTNLAYESQAFPAKETHVGGVGAALPQRGIKYAEIDYATKMTGKLNLIDMTFYTNRTDITGLQFEVPLVNPINGVVYSSNSLSAFFSISDGGEYPCGNNDPGDSGTSNPKCFIYNGVNTEMGFPTIITMFDITYTSRIKARLLIYNPDVDGVWFSINVKAFSGTPSEESTYGKQYVGYWRFENVFQTEAGLQYSQTKTNYYYSYYLGPNKGTWRDQTQWVVKQDVVSNNNLSAQPAGSGGYAIIEVLLADYTSGLSDDEFCVTDFSVGQALTDDMLILNSKQSRFKKAFFIKKWSSSSWTIRYFKCKHYRNRPVAHYYPTQIIYEQTTHYLSTNSFSTSGVNQGSIRSFEVIKNRALIEVDMSTVINQVIGQGFSWEDDINYYMRLYLSFGSYFSWSSISSCYVTGGFINTQGNMPTCTDSGSTNLYIFNFQSIKQHSRFGSYIVKFELIMNPYYNLANTLSVQYYLYANSDASSYQYIFYTYTPSFSRSINVRSAVYDGVYCLSSSSMPYSWTNQGYTNYNGDELNVVFNSFEPYSSSTLSMQFSLQPKVAKTLIYTAEDDNYPIFRFDFEGYHFSCSGFNTFTITYDDNAGTVYSYNISPPHGSISCGTSYFEVQFQALADVTGNWAGLSTFDVTENIIIDVQLVISANEQAFRSQWIGVRSFIYYFAYDDLGYTCFSCPCNHRHEIVSGMAFTDQHIFGYMEELADTFTLTPLSTNVGLPTEMTMTFIQIYPQIGQNNQGKILLIEFDSATQPFTYLNSTQNNQQIECKCITSWTVVFSSSSTSEPECIVRKPQGVFSNFAITINMDVSQNQNLECYFPEWQVTSRSYTATAKLVNEANSYAPNIEDANTYGGIYQTVSNTITFSTTPATNGLTISQTPSALYGSAQTVNTVLTSSYSLVINLDSGSILKPIVYVDFQKSGLIPDSSICSSSAIFEYCRVYNTFRSIIIAKYVSGVPLTSVSFTKGVTNLLFPKHKQPGAEYDVLVRMLAQAETAYTYEGSLTRSSISLQPTVVSFHCYPELTTSTLLETLRTNMILSFKMGGHILFSYRKTGAKVVITESTASLLTTQRGCTASSLDDPTFFFDCEVSGGEIIITNQYYSRTFSSSGFIQVIVGITNPSTVVTWTVKSYEYYIDGTNYGLQLEATTTYTPTVATGTEQSRSLIRMMPFNTKVYSTSHSPFRIAFKLSNEPPSLPDDLDYASNYFMILTDVDEFSSFSNFECLYKEYSQQPTSAPQSPLPNSFRNWKQHTQYIPLYTYCTKINSTSLQIQMPRIKALNIDYYYELVIMPTGTTLTQTGFNNGDDADFRMIAYPDSCQFIGQLKQYYDFQFELYSFYLVTTRPETDNALQLHFGVSFSSGLSYPNHYMEVVFEDINFDAIKAPYNTEGSEVPCTLSSDFVVAGGRTNSPHCVVNYVHEGHGTLVVRVVEIGSLAASTSFTLSLDDFLLPDLSSLQEPSNPFSICLRFQTQSTALHYERCFEQLFVIDQFSNNNSVNSLTGTFHDPTITNYGTSVTGKVEISYPVSSSSSIDEKVLMRMTGGYGDISPSLNSVGYHNLLWYNPDLSLYIMRQTSIIAGANINISLSGLINPQPYQKSLYENTYNIQLTYYSQYHPHSDYVISQPLYSIFTKNPSLVLLSSAYSSDIQNSIPMSEEAIIQVEVEIDESVADLTTKLNDLFQIEFDVADVGNVLDCWVDTVSIGVSYASDGACQTTANKVLLHNFYQANVNHNLTIFIKITHLSQNIDYISRLYSDNGEIQYQQSYSTTIAEIDTGDTPHPTISFTENMYTLTYFEQMITPLTISSTTKYLYFSMFLPEDIEHVISTVTITLPVTIAPANTGVSKQVCEWLIVDRYGRKYDIGAYSHCEYLAPDLVIQAPYGGLPAYDGADRIPYLLRVREADVINTQYTMPTTSLQEQITVSVTKNSVTKSDTFIYYPYEHFSTLSFQHTTLNTDQLNTYHIEFTPASTISVGVESVLQISLDVRYMHEDLGIQSLLSSYGVDKANNSRIDNLDYNILHDLIGDSWINGDPYSCYTSTISDPEQTCISTGNGGNTIKITHSLEPNYLISVPYLWKIPLLKNPSLVDQPFRMNLTLWTYQTGSTLPQKQLFYQIINEVRTSTYSPSSITYDFTDSPSIQSSTVSVGIQMSDAPLMGEWVQLKITNSLTGLINVPDLLSYTQPDLSYDFFFFPRINMLLCEKLVSDSSLVIDTGATQVSNEYVDYIGYEWLKIHSSLDTTKVGSAISEILSPCTITTLDNWIVSEGISNSENSQMLISLTFTNANCWIPKNSTFVLDYSANSNYEHISEAICYTSFRNSFCRYTDSATLQVMFDEDVAINTAVTIEFYLKTIGSSSSSTQLTGYIYGVPDESFTRVIEFTDAGQLNIDDSSLIGMQKMQHIQIAHIYEDSQINIRGTITPNFPFTFINLKHPFAGSLSSIQRLLLRQNSTSPYSYSSATDSQWVEYNEEVLSTTEGTHSMPDSGLINYDIQNLTQYTFILQSTYDPATLNNFTVGTVGSFYRFEYLTQNQKAYEQVYPIPVAQHVTIINPLKEVSEETVLGISFSVTNHSVVSGDRIHIQLDTTNLQHDMFRKTSEYSVQCVCVPGVLSNQPLLPCQASQYPTAGSPNTPLVITVYPSLTISATTTMQVWLSPIYNPDEVMVAGVTVRVDRECGGQQRCMFYEGRGYYRTTSSLVKTTGLTGTFTPSVTEILTEAVDHSFAIDSETYEAIFVTYPDNYEDVMPDICSESGGNICILFPVQRKVLTILPSVSTSTITFTNMNNGIYVKPTDNFIVKCITATGLNVYDVEHGNLTTRQAIPQTGTTTYLTISPTQTPNIFLRNYMNTATLTIYGLYSTTFVKAFYINAPSDVSYWDSTYCNATMEASTHDPYPTRLTCSHINDTTLQILIPEGVEENYVVNITEEYMITVHAKFFIEDFGAGDGILYVSPAIMTDTFNAYGSYSVSDHGFEFYITEASTPIEISEHRVPIVGDIQFNTESFEERVPNVNQPTNFQLLIDPTTSSPIDRIEVIIPEQFGYPPVYAHDACELITTLSQPLTSCHQIRRGNKTIISIQMPSHYDNGPRILTIGSTDEDDWFTAPSEPGNWYNVSILMYDASNVLLEAELTNNCSRIGGYEWYFPNVSVSNGQDAQYNEIVDVSFITQRDVRQGYSDGLSEGEQYTEIRIWFENLGAFAVDLGLGLADGQLVGCVTQGLSYHQQIKCKLDHGENVNDEPYISITGYQYFYAETPVTISLANILNLPAGDRSTLSIAIIVRKVGSNRWAYFYNHVHEVLLETSTRLVTAPTDVLIEYDGVTVNSPTIFNFTITPSSDIEDYFVIKLPLDGINNQYSLFEPACAQASQIDIFYRSDMVRIYPLVTHTAGTTLTYSITGFPTPQYASSTQWTIQVQGYTSLKQVNHQTVTMVMNTVTCGIDFGVIGVSSPYAHDTGVTYQFSFTIPRDVYLTEQSSSLVVGLQVPVVYGDMREGATCSVSSGALCSSSRVYSFSIIDVIETGQLTHTVSIAGINNPEQLLNTFRLSVYEGSEQYTMCSAQTTVELYESNVRQCTWSLSTEHSATKELSIYNGKIQCEQALKNNSQIWINIPEAYTYHNPIITKCWSSQPFLLTHASCTIVYKQGNYYIYVNQTIINNNQQMIDLQWEMYNPISDGNYFFSAAVSIGSFVYATTQNVTIKIIENSVREINSMQLTNMPSQSGEQAVYMLRVPSSAVNQSLTIDFPEEFDLPQSLQCYIATSSDAQWASSMSLQDALQISAQPLNSTISTIQQNSRLHLGNFSLVQLSDGTWTYFIIKYIINPPYQSNNNFTVSSYYSSNLQLPLLTHSQSSPLSFALNSPSASAHHIDTTVSDDDLLYLAQYTLTYQLDEYLQVDSCNFYITPPFPYTLTTMNSATCCLITVVQICVSCEIFDDRIMFVVQEMVRIEADESFKIRISKLYNPPSEITCSSLEDHINSYFALSIVKNDKMVTHASTKPFQQNNSPCVVFEQDRADILPTLPSTLYAGIMHQMTIELTAPSSMLKINIQSTSSAISFSPSTLFFNHYDTTTVTVEILVSSFAVSDQEVYINITHQQSAEIDLFRPNLPILVQVVGDHQEYVYVEKMKAESIGEDIDIDVTLSAAAVVDMVLVLDPQTTNQNFVFSSTEILIPAQTTQTSFSFRYEGTTIPPTLNISLSLSSSSTIIHKLFYEEVYFHFSQSRKHKTLPRLMMMKLKYEYRANKKHQGRRVYNVLEDSIQYDDVRPEITSHADYQIGSTMAQISIHTREEAKLAYVIYEEGEHLENQVTESAILRKREDANHAQTVQNSSAIVNPSCILNLTSLEQQTTYYLYIMAYSSLGNSISVTTHKFTTKVLSNACFFKLITFQPLTEQVYIIKTFAKILKISPNRIKVVSSEKRVSETYSGNHQNKPKYDQEIIVSPSLTKDLLPPCTLIEDRLTNNQKARKKLKRKIPSWVEYFPSEGIKLMNRVKPTLKSLPTAKRISYYNATFTVAYEGKVRLHAILQEKKDQTQETLDYAKEKIIGKRIDTNEIHPNSKKISRGKGAYNHAAKSYFTTLSDDSGNGNIFFQNLNPGSFYQIFLTATSPESYDPIIYADDTEITKIEFYTLWNPNLRNRNKVLLEDLKQFNSEMYEAIKEYYDNSDEKKMKAS